MASEGSEGSSELCQEFFVSSDLQVTTKQVPARTYVDSPESLTSNSSSTKESTELKTQNNVFEFLAQSVVAGTCVELVCCP